MSDGPTGSTVPRRQLGRYLRDLRNQAGLTVRAAARELERAEATIWRIETGQTSLRSVDVEVMCKVYGASGGVTKALKALAKETKAKGWWHAYGDVIAEGFDLFIGLEEATERLDWYESDLVPGLLQTPDYARAIISAHLPDEGPDEVERRVQLRMARQVLLSRFFKPVQLSAVVSESVLRRPVGGHTMMVEQLKHLADVSGLPNVAIRVVPFNAGLHMGALSGMFGILRFPCNGEGREVEPSTVYAEGFTGALYLDKPAELERYDRAFKDIWHTALDENESKHLIMEMAGKYAEG
ncbi:helix-turn-helix domain-containing protein [Streptomyces sp. AV19]|uniref:helix-turn-helix domain-containing protein n=1 Tax=Streptomyces sp. AV19 TaxID=2793068 RepID=UPI0018FE8226|nr:helix-turn-helix transcriptional regulator [Streptomyces sp. AV19]MBH1934497.1 helix-turn-helix domain-containing protein [Streptomyces sp. AV19]MDG4533291.1 helix-turn-helix domain-containing protein [Streptomyces sp. AV19]